MSTRNIEVVQRLYEAWLRQGFGVVPELMDPAIEYVNPSYAVEPGTRRGYDGFAAAASAVTSIYGDYAVSAVSFREIGERVVVRARVGTQSHGNEVPIEAERGYVFDLRDGKIVRFAWFNDPLEALAEAGLDADAELQADPTVGPDL